LGDFDLDDADGVGDGMRAHLLTLTPRPEPEPGDCADCGARAHTNHYYGKDRRD
jgi:hypothetical protein